MSELRLNRITGDWVIVASQRAKRPEDFRRREQRMAANYLESCPFCPGNESFRETHTYYGPDGGWKNRIVRGKYPALEPDGDKNVNSAGLKRSMNGVGYHEVMIESPHHNQWLWDQPVNDIWAIFEAMKARYIEMIQDSQVELVVLFKNHGPNAGSTLEHPHCQIVATPVMPTDVRRRLQDSIRFFDENTNCLFCTTMQQEQLENRRMVHESPHFISYIPYAALSPFQTLIFPRHHSPDFGLSSDEEVRDLAAHLRVVLRKIDRGLNNPDLNFVLRSLPLRAADPRCSHWYMSVIPRVNQASGFELGSEMFINTVLPEDAAVYLRGIPSE